MSALDEAVTAINTEHQRAEEWRKAAEAALGELRAAIAERDAAWEAHRQALTDLAGMTSERDDWRRRASNHATRVKTLIDCGDLLLGELNAEHALASDNACDGDCGPSRAAQAWAKARRA